MNVLIIGLGYAGTRFLQAFNSINSKLTLDKINMSYVDKQKIRDDIPYFSNIATALLKLNPEIVVVSVTDGAHADILLELEGYQGFVICEKPLVNVEDNLSQIAYSLKNISGFCMDMVERYSETTRFLKSYIRENQLKLLRANFIWGKDRINDRRPTSGVVSEVIHPIDLIQWISRDGKREDSRDHMILKNAIGTSSDFSISGPMVIDSVAITSQLKQSVITGYSSFVNIIRQRTIDFILESPDKKLIYAHMVFDTPTWDIDSLKIWERTNQNDNVIANFTTKFPKAPKELHTIQKLKRLVSDVVEFVTRNKSPQWPFADLAESLSLQELLNQIEYSTQVVGPTQFVLGEKRIIFNDEGNLERLG
ncbi:Gfo/Idh/MocA family oxidoreductase [Piscirickettsia salmonis]|uniref:Gfo/Idh/MocA family oxidoreductase n=1 Tax=Piscirickettsia salmonis TaxID=1238 RepID=UPI0007C8E356|nr:Oxidoreductase family, NAD-binding Rossmann fold [Piscirickettsiaceae bacterium NZ-RLO1]